MSEINERLSVVERRRAEFCRRLHDKGVILREIGTLKESPSIKEAAIKGELLREKKVLLKENLKVKVAMFVTTKCVGRGKGTGDYAFPIPLPFVIS